MVAVDALCWRCGVGWKALRDGSTVRLGLRMVAECRWGVRRLNCLRRDVAVVHWGMLLRILKAAGMHDSRCFRILVVAKWFVVKNIAIAAG